MRKLLGVVGSQGAQVLGAASREWNDVLRENRINNGTTLDMAKVGENAQQLARFFEKHQELTALTLRNYNHTLLMEALKQLPPAFTFPKLRSFAVPDGLIQDAEINELLDHFFSRTPALTTLDLTGNRMGAAGARALANSENFKQLSSLYLQQNNIGAAGAVALANSTHLPQLTTLDLTGNRIGPEGARALITSTHFPHLTILDLNRNNIGAEQIQLLRHRFGAQR